MRGITRAKINEKRITKRELRRGGKEDLGALPEVSAPRYKKPAPFLPKTDAQAEYADSIESNTFTFGTGPAGTGKTYVAACKAAEHLMAHDQNKVILTRPAVEAAGEKLGYLPGKLEDKFGPYMKPLMNILVERLGRNVVESAVRMGRIQMIPMAFMRGETFKHSLIIADEMQNATREQLKMLLTRIGEGSRMVIDGDPDQTDIGGESGLKDAVYRIGRLRRVGVVNFLKSDIVRHSIIQDVIEAYES